MNHKTKTLSAVFAGLILVNIGGVAKIRKERYQDKLEVHQRL